MNNMIRNSGKKLLYKKDIKAMFDYGQDKTKRLLESGILLIFKRNETYGSDQEGKGEN